MDYQAHPEFDENHRRFLADLAEIVVHELNLHRQLAERDQQLKATDAKLEEAKAAKQRFMGIVSHELRTPLNAILGFGQLIADEVAGPVSPPSYKDYALHICDSGRRLETLIARVLEYSSAEIGDLRLVESAFSWRTLLETCRRASALEASRGSVALKVAVDPLAPAAFYGDEVQVGEIVLQLLRNAISFSQAGGQVRLALQAGQEGGASIVVADDGEGIDKARLDYIMTAFAQGDEDLTRRHEGMGLGLPIAKALAALHGGRLEIESTKGQGTQVSVHFPPGRNRAITMIEG